MSKISETRQLMKELLNSKLWFFIVFLSLVVFLDAHGQQGSRDLMAEYCTNNWIKDPVRCADYMPPDYEVNKDKYQAQEAEKAKQEITQSNLAKESQRTCPLGSHLGVDNFGNQVCLDSKTNQVVSNPQTSSPTFDNNTLIGIVVIVIIVIIGGIAVANRRKSEPESYDAQSIPRHGWAEIEKEQVRERQNGRCNKCGRPTPRWEYHHRDGNRSNDSLSNCEGLCPNCHSLETHEN